VTTAPSPITASISNELFFLALRAPPNINSLVSASVAILKPSKSNPTDNKDVFLLLIFLITFNRNCSSGISGGSGGGAEGTETTKGIGIQPTQNTPFVPEPGFNQYGNPGGDGDTLEIMRETMLEKEKQLIELLIAHAGVHLNAELPQEIDPNAPDIEKLLDISDVTARKYLNELESEGKIKQIGEVGRNVHYVLTP